MDSRLGRLRALMRTVPFTSQSFLGLTDYLLKDHRKFYPWGFAMNGQTSRLEATRQIIHMLNIEHIVETGTFRGTTTEWFSQFGIPVESVEANERYFAFSLARLSRFKNVELALNSSVPFLKERIAARPELRNLPHLFYLDAHWQNYLPLREELQLIFNCYTNAVVLIDDFMVVDDPGYGYDDYGQDKALNLDYLAHADLNSFSPFFPASQSGQETGARRGWVVLSPNSAVAKTLEKISLLRKYDALLG